MIVMMVQLVSVSAASAAFSNLTGTNVADDLQCNIPPLASRHPWGLHINR